VIDLGYHIIDQLIWWFGYPDDIYCKSSDISDGSYDTEDSATIAFSYHSGLHGSIILSRCSGKRREEYQIASRDLSVEGNKSELVISMRETGEKTLEKRGDFSEVSTDAQLDFFLQTLANGEDFKENVHDNLLNMKFIEQSYRGKLTKDQVLFVETYMKRTPPPERKGGLSHGL